MAAAQGKPPGRVAVPNGRAPSIDQVARPLPWPCWPPSPGKGVLPTSNSHSLATRFGALAAVAVAASGGAHPAAGDRQSVTHAHALGAPTRLGVAQGGSSGEALWGRRTSRCAAAGRGTGVASLFSVRRARPRVPPGCAAGRGGRAVTPYKSRSMDVCPLPLVYPHRGRETGCPLPPAAVHHWVRDGRVRSDSRCVHVRGGRRRGAAVKTLDQGGGGEGKRTRRGGVTDRASEQPSTRRRALPPSPRSHHPLPSMAGAAQRKTFRQDLLSRAGRSGPRWHFYCQKLLFVGAPLPATAAVSSATTPRAAARHASAVE